MEKEEMIFWIPIIAMILVSGMLVGYSLQKESDLQQIDNKMIEAAYSESHILSSSDGSSLYYITPVNYSNINVTNKVDNLTGCRI